jgi:Tol biopolymer transport system component
VEALAHDVGQFRGAEPLVAPDGAVAAALFGPRGPALVVYRAGAPAQKYFDLRKFSATPVAWSPDSRYLAVSQLSAAVTGNPGTGLSIIDTRTGAVETIAAGAICGASFAPAAPDRLIYGRSPASTFCIKNINLFTVNADGSGAKQLTHDGRSLNPAWGTRRIAFDRQTPRGGQAAPAYQVWVMNADGTHPRQITHMKIPQLVSGLAPMAFSADGQRLLAVYQGEDTSDTYTVTISTGKTHHITVGGQDVQTGGISRDGKQVLVVSGAFMNPPSKGTIETVPFAGGRPKVLVRHADQPSWNR